MPEKTPLNSALCLLVIAMTDYRIIDVSQWMGNFLFPGNPEFQVTGPFNRVSGNNPEFVYDFVFCSQTGTHIQGPHYFLESGQKIDLFPLSMFEGHALLVDLEKLGVDTTREDLVSKLQSENLAGQILVLRTGNMEEIIETGELSPGTRLGLSLGAAQYLAEEQRIKMIAIDSIGIESRETKDYEVSKYFCSKNVLLLEGLVNLSAVRDPRFFLEAFPLKIRSVEGTPCRAIIKEPISK